MGAGRWAGAAVGVLAAVGLAPAAELAPAPREAGFQVESHTDLAYVDGPKADPERHRLDLYVPKGVKDFPVLFFVHGGAWRSGNKGLYAPLGMTFARQGIGVVVINYRLSPKVTHPAHIEDVAAAFAWTANNVGKYGGRADRLFVSGHSAGGHLVALLALDDQYLKAVGRSAADVRGVLALSGVYEIPTTLALFRSVFGADEAVRKAASPLTHVAGKHPPFLLAYADFDYPGLGKMAVDLHAALGKVDGGTTLMELKDRNHYSIIINLIRETDPLTTAMRDFALKHTP